MAWPMEEPTATPLHTYISMLIDGWIDGGSGDLRSSAGHVGEETAALTLLGRSLSWWRRMLLSRRCGDRAGLAGLGGLGRRWACWCRSWALWR